MARTGRLTLAAPALGPILVSLAVHAGMIVLVGSGGDGGGRVKNEGVGRSVLAAYIAPPADVGQLALSSNTAVETSSVRKPRPIAAPTPTSGSDEAAPAVEITTPTGPYYFRSRELTRRPILLGDDISRLVVELPGFPPLPVILRLLISEEGSVDRVMVEDSTLPEAVESRIIEAFANVRFLPGKIDDIAVRSQLRVEVRLENAPGANASTRLTQ